MFSAITKSATVLLAGVLVSGCASNTYDTHANEVSLAQYAGKSTYPYGTKAEEGTHLFATIASDTKITLYNSAAEPLTEFELWVNGLYTLHIRKLEAKSSVTIDPKDVYNSKVAETLVNAPPSTITSVQIFTDGKLIDVQGPIISK